MTVEELKQAIEEKKALIKKIESKIAALPDIKGKERPVEMTEDELQETQYRNAALALMEKDPAKALDLLNKADVIRERITSRSKELSPDQARQQLRIARDNARSVVSSTSDQIDKRTRDLAAKEVLIYSAEMAKTNPSVQLANQKVDELYRSTIVTGAAPTGQIELGKITDLNSAYALINSELAKIKYKGKDLDAAVSNLEQLISDSGIAPADIAKALDNLKSQADNKPGAPGKIDIKEKVNELTQSKNNTTTAKAAETYNKAIGAYQSAKAAYDSKNWGTAIGNFLYSLRPEAVNEGDIEIAKNGSATITQKGINALSAKFGVNTTDLEKIAKLQGESAYKALNNKRTNGIDLFETWLDKKAKGSEATSYIKSLFTAPVSLSGSIAPSKSEDVSNLPVWNNKLTDAQKRKVYKIGQKVRVGTNAFTVYEKANKTLGIK